MLFNESRIVRGPTDTEIKNALFSWGDEKPQTVEFSSNGADAVTVYIKSATVTNDTGADWVLRCLVWVGVTRYSRHATLMEIEVDYSTATRTGTSRGIP
ncbi:MAG: hypothetical protein JWL82_590 [Parcubacteria group bacterium]|nr:hypothetical protein [Parcubacteria group bacterium]